MVEKAYAKINLFLSVGDKRADGYHDIDTVMHTVSLFDTVELSEFEGLRVECAELDIPKEQNLAFRAAQAFFSHTGIIPSVRVSVNKRIPAQAGLGGGSADAAAVLRGLNKMYSAGLSLPVLAGIGSTLGADIPFCVYGGKARCRGIGDIILPLETEHLHLVIIKPQADCPTGKMYSALDNIQRTVPVYGEVEYFNSFDSVCPAECRAATQKLLSLGAETAMLSGSGSAVFGIFATEESARKAENAVKHEYPFVSYAYTL